MNVNRYSPKGRGTVDRPPNRFEKQRVEEDPGAWEEIAATDPDFEPARPGTLYLRDDSQSIVTKNSSPDIGFEFSLNPYRGCEHGCAYCYARPYHEYLGYDAGLDFETRILVKERAPELLETKLSSSSWTPAALACSGITDPYQPVERTLGITRRCLEVLAEFRNPVGIITKNALVTRDLDLLASLAAHGAAKVAISITTLDVELAGALEPRASRPRARLEAIRQLNEAGIPAGVSVAPLIPGLNEHEIPRILEAAAGHGAAFASGTLLRLPHGVKDIFAHWLDLHRPERRELILGRLREMRGGRLNDPAFGRRMTGSGPLATQMRDFFALMRRRHSLAARGPELSTQAFRRCLPGQLELF